MMGQLMRAENISQHFGGVRAVDGITMHVDEGEILGIIGPNGSGKTTFFNALTGIYAPTAGTFMFRGENITGLPMHEIVRRGISRTFQNLRTFRTLTVRQNVIVGQHTKMSTGVFGGVFKTSKCRAEERRASERADTLVHLVGLKELADRLSCELSYGQQKRLELARAMASDSRLLLLDEPAAGIPSEDAQELLNLILTLRKEHGVTVIIIEHNMRAMRHVADRVVAMDRGKKICEGTCDDVLSSPCVIEAYLGEEQC